MILVSVGTDDHDFSRLVREADSIASGFDEKFLLQLGNTEFEPKNCEYFRFLEQKKFLEKVKESNIVITHAGVGSVMNSLKFGKATVVVPRREKFGEHVNDHQLDIARELEREGKVITCYDIENLEEKIKEAEDFQPEEVQSSSKIRSIIKKFLEDMND